ncbi:hypothetical protein [Ruania alba]|uniref:hypothetical protein n=1 Tax=Ruania alba TaxID=648782 RepID=UPI000B7CA0CB|nr:hypothetical protein [Ruania alba]
MFANTYASFYRNDFGEDTERVAALLQANPNVILLNSHTHWSPELKDWSVQHWFDPAATDPVTIVNTVAVTTQYGPSGDWGGRGIGGADPAGLKIALYEDQVRASVYAFGADGAREVKRVDVPVPQERRGAEPAELAHPGGPGEPADPADPAVPAGSQ